MGAAPQRCRPHVIDRVLCFEEPVNQGATATAQTPPFVRSGVGIRW